MVDMVCVDGSENADKALEFITKIAQDTDQILLYYAYPRGPVVPSDFMYTTTRDIPRMNST
jgi:hypothetical protein